MKNRFKHRALNLTKKTKVIFIAMSKTMFYFRRHATKFVLQQGYTPISQYGIFDFFLTDSVNRDLVRQANNNLLRIADEVWVFGPISNGVFTEIKLAKSIGKPVRYFKSNDYKNVQETTIGRLEFEDNIEQYKEEL